jgi:predicted O-methyltransferase YrrM
MTDQHDPAVWTAVEEYFTDRLRLSDPVLDAALEASADLPPISVTPAQGRLLGLLAELRGARRVLEIGTLGGYSTIWLARALPADGELISLEAKAEHAEIATANLTAAGVADRATVLVGPALDSLPTLSGPFDLVFIDADKENNPDYFRWAVRLSRPGTLIVVDNIVRGGRVADPDTTFSSVIGSQRVTELIGATPGVRATVVPLADSKGFDGFLLAVVDDPTAAADPR